MVTETARINFEATNLDVVEARIKAIGGAINVLGGSVEVVVGAMGLIGVDEKVTEQFQKAATSAIAFADGAKRVFEGYKELREAADLFRKAQAAGTGVTALNTAATTANNAVQTSSIGILGRARAAWRALTLAISANPITAAAIAIGALVTTLIAFSDAEDDAKEKTDEYNRSLELQKTLSDELNQSIDLRRRLFLAQGGDAVIQAERDIIQANEDLAEALKQVGKEQDLRQKLLNAGWKTTDAQIVALDIRLQKAENNALNAQIKIADANKVISDSYKKAIEDAQKASEQISQADEKRLRALADNITNVQTTLGQELEVLYGKLLANVAGDVTNIDTFAVAITNLRKGAIDEMVKIGQAAGSITEEQANFFKNRQQDLEVFLTLFAMGTDTTEMDIETYRKELIKVITETDNKVKDFAQQNPDLFKYGFSNLEKVVPDLIQLLKDKGYTDPTKFKGAIGKLNKALLDILIVAENEQTQALADEITKRTTLTAQSRQQEINDLTSKYLLEDEMMKNHTNDLTSKYLLENEMMKGNTSVRERLQEEFRRKLAEINKKWDDIDAEQAQANYNKLVEISVRAQVKQIEAESKDADDRLVRLRKFFEDQRRDNKNNAEALAAINKVAAETFIDGAKTQFEAAQEEIAKFVEEVNKYAQLANIAIDSLSGIQRANHELRLNQIEAEYQERARSVVGSEEQIAEQLQRLEIEKNKKLEDEKERNFERSKKYQIAEATIAGLTGAATAFATAFQLGPIAGPIVGGILAALVLANTAAQINLIKKQKYIRSDIGAGGLGGGIGGGTRGGGTGLSGIGGGNFLQPIPNPGDPGNRTGSSNNPFGFMRAPTTSPNTPIRAYVVASDVSNGLEAERALNTRRRL